jgi:hypothetical protein
LQSWGSSSEWRHGLGELRWEFWHKYHPEGACVGDRECRIIYIYIDYHRDGLVERRLIQRFVQRVIRRLIQLLERQFRVIQRRRGL